MRRLNDLEAIRIADELLNTLDWANPADENYEPEIRASFGRIAYKLCLPLVVGNIRDASPSMIQKAREAMGEGTRHYVDEDDVKTIWEAAISALLEETER